LGANKYGRPTSIIHLSTGEWTSESTPEQRQAAIDGIKTMAGEIRGIKNIWIKAIRVQPREFQLLPSPSSSRTKPRPIATSTIRAQGLDEDLRADSQGQPSTQVTN